MQGGREQTEEAVVLVVCFFRLLCFQEITDTWWQQHNIMQEKKKSPALQQCDMLCSTVQTIQSMCCAFTGNALRHDFQTIREETDSRLGYNTSRAVRLTYFIARALVILPRWQKWRQWTKLYDISTLTVWKIKHTAIFYQSWKKIQTESFSFKHEGLSTGCMKVWKHFHHIFPDMEWWIQFNFFFIYKRRNPVLQFFQSMFYL